MPSCRRPGRRRAQPRPPQPVASDPDGPGQLGPRHQAVSVDQHDRSASTASAFTASAFTASRGRTQDEVGDRAVSGRSGHPVILADSRPRGLLVRGTAARTASGQVLRSSRSIRPIHTLRTIRSSRRAVSGMSTTGRIQGTRCMIHTQRMVGRHRTGRVGVQRCLESGPSLSAGTAATPRADPPSGTEVSVYLRTACPPIAGRADLTARRNTLAAPTGRATAIGRQTVPAAGRR